MTVSVFLDGLLVLLLVTTIVYAAILNRKLKQLRAGEAELKALLAEFNLSAAKAEANLGQMKSLAGRAQADVLTGGRGGGESQTLKQQIDRAQALKDDLDFLIERGGATADRLVELLSQAREAARTAGALAGRGRGAPDEAGASAVRDAPEGDRGRPAVNLSAVPLAPAAPAATPATPRKAAAPSVAERELLKALRAVRPAR